MKIALVACHADPAGPRDPRLADQAAHVRGLGRALADRGHRVIIFARRESAATPDTATFGRNLTVRYLTAGPAAPAGPQELPSYAGAFGAELAGWLRRSRPDIVHAYHWTSGLAALAAAREYHVPVVVSFGSLAITERDCGAAGRDQAGRDQAGRDRAGLDQARRDQARRDQARRIRLEACVGRAADGVLAATTHEAADLARLGVPAPAVRVVPFGTELAQASQRGKIRGRGAQVRLVCLDPLDADRRVDVLVRAMPGLPGAELVIAGEAFGTEPGTSQAARRLGKLAAELGVADRVIFTGKAAHGEFGAALRRADIVVSAARHEPLGRAVLSAMACGLPVVATDTGAYRDAVTDGSCGLLVPVTRPELIGQRLRDLLATPIRVAAFGIGAADRAASRYSWHRVAGEAEAAYGRVLVREQAHPGELGDSVTGRRAA